ncbi:MAG TPA: o-succinylbenzoate--CoA ligase [Oscillatoriaceae cyanobacterium]
MTKLATTLQAPTLEAARRFPDAPALRYEGTTLTHAELEAHVIVCARRLLASGVASDTTIALWGANSLDWVVTAHAIARLGARLLPLSTRLTDAELNRAIAPLDVALLVGESAFTTRAEALGIRALSFQSLAAANPVDAPLPDGWPADTPLALLLTSGTTGVPKAVTLTWGNVLASAAAVSEALELTERDTWWLGMPTFHVGGLGILFRCALNGACVLMHPRFEAARLKAAIAHEGVTVASLVPTMLQALLDALDGPWPETLRAVMLGGAAAPATLLERCPVALHTYGLTEACSTVTLVRAHAGAQGRLSSGTPLPGVSLRILREDGSEAAVEEVGLVTVRGPNVTHGYWGNPEATSRVLRGGWLTTGDYGRLDTHGNLHVAARREDLIISGGENIYPAEIESILSGHGSIQSVAVVAMPDARWGQVPCAFVVPRADLDAESLAAWMGERMARFKHPKAYRFLDALPLLANGKVDRASLRRLVGS